MSDWLHRSVMQLQLHLWLQHLGLQRLMLALALVL